MVKYDFNMICSRKNTDCFKWDGIHEILGRDDIIPMWVADMDFPVAKPITEAIKKRADHPFYGYTKPGPSVAKAVVERMKQKFSWEIQPEWIVFTPGVVPALHIAIRSLTHPGDGVVLQKPVYYPFFPAVTRSGCQIVNNNLKLVGDHYEMDYEDLEDKFASKGGPSSLKAMMICNLHNPVGRHWSEEELIKAGEIAIENGAKVISDGIHCEILFKGKHIPFASIFEEFQENSVVCMAPSKTFNLAGLEISTIIIPNKKLRDEFVGMQSGMVPRPNLFGYTALEAAYRSGDNWLEQVLDYLKANLNFLMDYIEKIPGIRVIEPEGTYLVWLDCRELGMDGQELRSFMLDKAKVGMDDGFLFGDSGEGFMRMNIACPRPILQEALGRIEGAVLDLGE